MKPDTRPLRNDRWHGPPHKYIKRRKRQNLSQYFSFFTSLSIAKAHICGVKFIGLYGTVGFIAIRDFSFWGGSDLWSDVWPAIEGLVCCSILLEGEITVSNNFSIRRQNGFKIARRDKYATHLREENFIQIIINTFFLWSVTFPYNSL